MAKIDAGPERTTVQFVKQPPFDPGNLILLVQRTAASASTGKIASASSAARRYSPIAWQW